jgi:hypothetical protein
VKAKPRRGNASRVGRPSNAVRADIRDPVATPGRRVSLQNCA